MGQIRVKFDHTLKQSDIIVRLTNTSHDEAGENYIENQQEIQQTSIYGIQAPLIMVNNIVVDFPDVIYFNMKCINRLPSIQMIIRDRKRLISMINTPGIDNELRVQILPKFDDKYKKINLTFYITSFKCDNDIISLSGDYKVSKFTSDMIKSFGEINTYDLFESIAKETGLGLASNVDSNDDDKRFVYCDNKSYETLLEKEIKRSGSDLKVFDYWVDWWNNLTLVDIYERYNTIDSEDDMKLWVSGQNHEMTEGIKIVPIEVPAVLNNHPSNETMELYTPTYTLANSMGNQKYSGTDKVYSIYETNNTEYKDHLIQDGAVKKDVFTKLEYLGENYGKYNYLLSEKKRDSFMQKISANETIKVTLKTPLLGLLRGNKVNFLWYYNDDSVRNTVNTLKDEGMINDVKTDVPIIESMPDEEAESLANDGAFIIDDSVSGQYLITGQEMKFENMEWSYILTLCRSSLTKPQIINSKDE